MAWTIDRAVDWDADTLERVASLFDDPRPSFPPRFQRIGHSAVAWWEPEPGVAVIHAIGGTPDDRSFAEQYTRLALESFGYRRARFTLDLDPETKITKEAKWGDIMQKAKRLVDSGQVTILRNGFNNVLSHVIGDHGEYNCEIGRDDPSSRAITGWTCECPWDQYAFQRTRQWKKYEGRVCSHVLASFWKALGTPLDEDLTPEQGAQIGTGQNLGVPQSHPSPVETQPGVPSTFTPQGEPVIGQQPDLMGGQPQDVPLGPMPGPQQAPMAPPGAPGVLPPSPMEQLQMLQPPLPGTSPAGMPAPPGSVSVPGARPPSPFNPGQFPDGTYSKVAAEEFNAPEIVRLKEDSWGLAEGKSEEHGAGQYQRVPAGSTGEVLGQDQTTGWVEVIFPLEGGELSPYHVRVFLDASDITHTNVQPPGPFIKRHTHET